MFLSFLMLLAWPSKSNDANLRDEMNKKIFNKRFFLTTIGSSAIGTLLSLLVVKPLMHMAGDPPWLRQTVIVTLSGVIMGIFAVILLMRLAAHRHNSPKG